MTISNELKKFYHDYWAWLQAGAPEGEPFTRELGLCWNAGNIDYELCRELALHFESKGANPRIPFDLKGISYIKESAVNQCHLNPHRIAWVKRMVEEYPLSEEQ